MPGRWSSLRALALLLPGCGFQVSAGPSDGAPPRDAADAPVQIDAAVDAAPLGPWGTPVRVGLSLPGVVDDDPSLTGDMLELYFASNRAGGLGFEDLWVAKRASATQDWSAPVLVPNVNSVNTDSNVEVSRDGLTLVFTSYRGGNYDLWIATRPSRNDAWTTPTLASELSSLGGDWGAVISDDRLRVVLCSDRTTDEEKLYETTRASTADPWPAPVAIAALDVPTANDCDGAVLDPDTIYFSSDRGGGAGDIDLWVGETTSTRFDTVSNLTELNSALRDNDPWISPDHRTLYFSSNRAGSDDLYVTTR